jgi:hypothetical protein
MLGIGVHRLRQTRGLAAAMPTTGAAVAGWKAP